MTGLCSIHPTPDPACPLCQAHPRDLFPDWDQKVQAAQAAGTRKCAACGSAFFRTVPACPKCSLRAEPVVLLAVQSCQSSLATEVMWFVNEWCKEAGWLAPRMTQTGDLAFTIHAYPPPAPSPAQSST